MLQSKVGGSRLGRKIRRGREMGKRRRGKQFAVERVLGASERSSLYRLLRGSKAEAKSPIHKGGQRQEGELRQSAKYFREWPGSGTNESPGRLRMKA